jgi:ribonuclease E
MKKKILINAAHAEEKRVAIVEGEKLVDFYVESSVKEHMKGNIYKGVVTRIEPGLQAAFVNFGPKKHGFLQIREINPEYFKDKAGGKRVKLQEVISKGQELIVQVEKDERDTKGASLTTYVSLPGRYIVMMPGQERVGISRKIEAREDRDRLKEMFSSLKLPKNMGFILRTAGSDRTGEELENDLKYLTKLWTRIQADAKKAAAPALIYKEQDIAVRTVRDYLTSDVAEVLIDDQDAYRQTKEFLKKTTPWRKINIKLHKEKTPIFSLHNIEEQILKLHDRYVYLPSRGYLVIDKTEALTAVDVNSGRSRKEENVEATAFRTNMEAAEEVSRQLRLRDIGGLIVIDFIDMMSSKNRRDVENRLKDALSTDKAHNEVTGISKFGMVEMTRERMRTAYFESINRKCEACGGSGIIKTDEMLALTALREMHTRAANGGIKKISCHLPVESLNYLINTKRAEIALIEKEFSLSIRLAADAKLFPGQYVLTVEKLHEERGDTAEEKKAAHRPAHHAEHKAVQKGEQEVEHKEEHGAEHTAGHQSEAERRHKRSRGRRRGRRGAKAAHAGEAGTIVAPSEEAAKTEGPAAVPEAKQQEGREEQAMSPQQDAAQWAREYAREAATSPGEQGTEEQTALIPEKQALPEAEGERAHTGVNQPESERRHRRSRGRRRGRRGARAAHAGEAGGIVAPSEETAKTEGPAALPEGKREESREGHAMSRQGEEQRAERHDRQGPAEQGTAGEPEHLPAERSSSGAETASEPAAGKQTERPKRSRARGKSRGKRAGKAAAPDASEAQEGSGTPAAEPVTEEPGA